MKQLLLFITIMCCVTTVARAQSLEEIALSQLKQQIKTNQSTSVAILPLPLPIDFADTLMLQLPIKRNGRVGTLTASWYWVNLRRLPDFDNTITKAIAKMVLPKELMENKKQKLILKLPMTFKLVDSSLKTAETLTYIQEDPVKIAKDYPAKTNFYHNEYSKLTGNTNYNSKSSALPSQPLNGYVKRTGGKNSWVYLVYFDNTK